MGKGWWLEWLGLVRSRPVSLEAFRDRVVDELLSRKPDLEVARCGEDDLRVSGGNDLTVARAYAYYREHPRDLDLVVRQLVDLAFFEPPPATPEDLIVLVRPATYQADREGERDRGPARVLPGGLVAIVAVDRPENYRFATPAELRGELGMDDHSIWDRAVANLRARLDPTPPIYRPGYVMGLKTGLGLASSLLVDDSYWAHANLSSLGDLVVAPLERDELVLAPLDEPQLVQALRNIVARREGSDFLSDSLLLRRDGRWQEFE